MPAYNAAQFLHSSVESVLAQTYDHWQLIIVDDASTDDTYEIASDLAQRAPDKIRIVRLTENGGTGEARNCALDAAEPSELVSLLDADDYLMPTYLERQVERYEQARAAAVDVGILCVNARLLMPDGREGATAAELFGWREDIDISAMLEKNWVLISATVPRAVIDAVGRFATDCDSSADFDMWLRIMEAGHRVMPTREALFTYRVHPSGMSGNLEFAHASSKRALERALGRGQMSGSQRRKARRRIRHERALIARARVRRAWRERRYVQLVARSVVAVLLGLVALLQQPTRWLEWLLPTRSRPVMRP
jgi:glycosyltransferase involved in cell wall biosynthesis